MTLQNNDVKIQTFKPTSCSPPGRPRLMVKWIHEVNTKATRICVAFVRTFGSFVLPPGREQYKVEPTVTRRPHEVTRMPHKGHTEATRRFRMPHEPKTSGSPLGVLWHAKYFFTSPDISPEAKNAPVCPPEGLGRPHEWSGGYTNPPEFEHFQIRVAFGSQIGTVWRQHKKIASRYGIYTLGFYLIVTSP